MIERFDLRFSLARIPMSTPVGHGVTQSEIDVSASGDDLNHVFRELLRQLPIDVYDHLREALTR